jgi:hypothetical protein
MAQHTLTESWAYNNVSERVTVTQTGTLHQELSETIPAATNNHPLSLAIDVSAAKMIFVVSDQDVLLETNSGSAPDDTISLLADVPYVWHADSYFANLLAADVTQLFITNQNGAGVTAEFRCYVLTDATP